MARSGTGIGYTPSQTSTSMPGSFDEEQMAIARKRAMMQQLANEAPVDSGYKGSHWVNPYYAQLGPALTQGLNALAQPEMDSQLQDIAARRGAAQDAWAANPPRLEDTPADPGNAGPSEGPGMMGPPAPMPGYGGAEVAGDQNQMGREYARALAAKQQGMGQDATINMETGAPTALADTQMQPLQAAPDAPMVPQAPQDFAPHRAATAMIPKSSLGEVMQWASKGSGFSPMAAKFGEHVMQQAFDAPGKKEAAAALVQAKKDTAAELASTRKHELTMKQMEGASEKERERLFKVSMAEYKQQNDLEKMTQMYEFKESLKAAGGGEGAKGTFVDAGTSLNGNPVLRNSRGTDFVEIVDGKPQPYTGKVVKTGDEKAVSAAQESLATQAQYENLAERVLDPKNADAFSKWSSAKAGVSNATGGFIDSGISQEHQDLRSEVSRDFAELTHKLYGSALSSGEQQRAKGFTVMPGESAERVAGKLRNQSKFLRDMDAKYSNKTMGAATARTGGAAQPATSGDGWGTPTKR